MQNNENQVPCMKVFLSLNKYHNHQRTHTNEFPYKCKVDGCHAKFNQKGNFITHLKSIHQIFDSDIWINKYSFTKIKYYCLKSSLFVFSLIKIVSFAFDVLLPQSIHLKVMTQMKLKLMNLYEMNPFLWFLQKNTMIIITITDSGILIKYYIINNFIKNYLNFYMIN